MLPAIITTTFVTKVATINVSAAMAGVRRIANILVKFDSAVTDTVNVFITRGGVKFLANTSVLTANANLNYVPAGLGLYVVNGDVITVEELTTHVAGTVSLTLVGD